MGPGVRMRGGLLRRELCFALMLAAILVKVMVPPGFMMGEGPRGFGLVICDGQRHDRSDQGRPAGHAEPCAFAGHGLSAPPPSFPPTQAPAPVEAYSVAIAEMRADLAPGRGLAAPPPPSQGPPAVL